MTLQGSDDCKSRMLKILPINSTIYSIDFLITKCLIRGDGFFFKTGSLSSFAQIIKVKGFARAKFYLQH